MEELISDEHAKIMRTLGPWEDGDTYRLGGGRFAEYHSRKRAFYVREKDTHLGIVPRSEVLGRHSDSKERR